MLRPRDETDRPRWRDGKTTTMRLAPSLAASVGELAPARADALAASIGRLETPAGAGGASPVDAPLNASELHQLELAQMLNASHGTLDEAACRLVVPFCLSHPAVRCPCDYGRYDAAQPDQLRIREAPGEQNLVKHLEKVLGNQPVEVSLDVKRVEVRPEGEASAPAAKYQKLLPGCCSLLFVLLLLPRVSRDQRDLVLLQHQGLAYRPREYSGDLHNRAHECGH